jgi:hypothetical protein
VGSIIGIESLYSAKSKIDLLPNNSSSFQGAARRGGHPRSVAGPVSSGPLVDELPTEVSDQVNDGGGHTKTARGPASEPSEQRLGSRSSRGPPGVFGYRIGAAWRRIGSSAVVPDGLELVETRRLELLTLSLQRRCSAN